MNCLKANLTTSTASFVSLLALTLSIGMQEVQAISSSQKTSTRTPSQSLPSDTSFKVAQVNPIRGQWKLRFNNAGIVHESVLRMNGYSGIMLTRFYDVNYKRSSIVQQTMRLSSTPNGLIILGYNPVFPGTKTRYPGYSADSFLFQINPNGSAKFVTCDNARRCSPVEVFR
ncbi:RDD domain-containing protein [Calothrix parasitica NIES-267]|uniref:RDD domain-containing protein n=1 Tax=Calothrix parasitica NIES-267 TaxID=1973488 RepID=A0A1Z4LXC2_9CYAN|nr:RDD domain-containing protein [Calothrix parasitica NIES-267]